MQHRFVVATFALVLFAIAFFSFKSVRVAESATPLPQDFEDALVASVGAPTALAFTPDGRLIITTQQGQVRIFQNGTLLSTPAVNLNSRLCTNSERGLLGVAVDPSFSSNRFVYFYYTLNRTGTCNSTAVNRVARFVLADNNTIDTASEVVLIDNIHSPAGNHNGGDIHFGKDALLYISVGDGGCDYANNSGCAGANDAARDRHVMVGKILRVTRDGAIPASNPFQGSNSGRCNVTGSTTSGNWCREIFATGLRNPFRIAFDSNAANTRFFINDVGQNSWEEIDEGISGADYGWNVREGRCANGSTTNCGAPPAGLTNPIFDYPRGCVDGSVSGNSITGGAFVPNGIWPAAYDNSYLFGEYVCGKIFKITPNGGGGYNASEFVTGLGSSSAVAMIFGPYESTQALYYTTYAGGGQVRRIRYTGLDNRDPVAQASANPTAGSAPLDVQFDASTSTDPDNDPLTFSWNFGDGTTGTGATPAHRYTATGTYDAVVTVSDGRGGTGTDTVRIDVGNTAPQPTISSPTTTQLFRVGETITLTGSATDQQDGPLPNNRLTWEVILHHNNDHTHPYLPPTVGNNITFTAPAPEDLQAATGSFLEIRLRATDSNGLSTTIVRNFQPRRVNITLATQPAGLNLTVNGTTVVGPSTIVSWDNYALNVNAPNQSSGGQQYTFSSWSDGGAASHTITTPASAATYTATFQTSGGGTLPAGWASTDVGSVSQAGSTTHNSGAWTIRASGDDIWNSADAFHLAYRTLTGDGRITARVTGVGNTDPWAKAGVMIRQNLNADSPHAMVVVTPGNGVSFQRRTTPGAASQSTPGARVTAPYWVRLERIGSTLSGYQSVDGSTWTLVGSATVSFTGNIYIGLAVTAHNNSALNTSTVSDVGVTNIAATGGLTGEYFDNLDFTNRVTTRRDATVNFNWGEGTPSGTALTGPDTFSVRWTGLVSAPVTGTYTFTTRSDDGVRLWVNNQLIINNWTDHSETNNSGTISLNANTSYDIRMEYYENSGGAVARLYWSYPGRSRQIIPSSRLSVSSAAGTSGFGPSVLPTSVVGVEWLISSREILGLPGF